MSALYAADNWPSAGDPTQEHPAAGVVDAAGTYLTDEVFLYRVVGVDVLGAVEVVELEDCNRLDVVRVPLRDLRARRLQVVTPSPLQR